VTALSGDVAAKNLARDAEGICGFIFCELAVAQSSLGQLKGGLLCCAVVCRCRRSAIFADALDKVGKKKPGSI
jgi:hypothetical protein